MIQQCDDMTDLEQAIVILVAIANRQEVHRLAKFLRRWEFELSSTSPNLNRKQAWDTAQEPKRPITP